LYDKMESNSSFFLEQVIHLFLVGPLLWGSAVQKGVWESQEESEHRTPDWDGVQLLVYLPFLLANLLRTETAPGQRHKMGFRE
jgi:hypothetical protein